MTLRKLAGGVFQTRVTQWLTMLIRKMKTEDTKSVIKDREGNYIKDWKRLREGLKKWISIRGGVGPNFHFFFNEGKKYYAQIGLIHPESQSNICSIMLGSPWREIITNFVLKSWNSTSSFSPTRGKIWFLHIVCFKVLRV